MAPVHRAYDTARGHIVALKRLELPTSFTSASAGMPATQQLAPQARPRDAARRRAHLSLLFQHEFRTLAQLAHPCIVEVYDYGLFDDRPYYTMELLEGSDLGRTGRLPGDR
jgi:eukaryotic-like serine/threonine-protein kinase